MYFDNLGYEYTDEGENRRECFDNIFLVYNNDDIFWMTCSDRTMRHADDNFNSGEIILFGFYLKKRRDYKMIFDTKITYNDILEDMRINRVDRNIKLRFGEHMYEQLKKFKIIAYDKDEAINKLKNHLNLFELKVR